MPTKTPFEDLQEIIDRVGNILVLERWIVEKLKMPNKLLKREFVVLMDDGQNQKDISHQSGPQGQSERTQRHYGLRWKVRRMGLSRSLARTRYATG